jgi:SulP family sulfate permease
MICNYNLKRHRRLRYRHQVRTILPAASDFVGFRERWRDDLLAGISVGVVALPLALGFGIATGTGATSGIITAIVAGFIAALFGGSRFQVSGPTGAMTVVLIPIVERYGVSIIAIVGVIAGVISILAGLLRLGRVFAKVPWSVLEGFTAGIGIVIALQQVPLVLDIEKPEGGNALLVAWKSLNVLSAGEIHPHALLTASLAIGVMVVSPKIIKKVPASIVTVVICTTVAALFNLSVIDIGALPRTLPLPSLPEIPAGSWSAIIASALAVFALGAIESVLSGKVAESLAHSQNKLHQPGDFDSNRELFGQGLATVASATMGGIPATGAIARTAVNVRSGAKTRISAMVHALFLLLCILILAPIVGKIPVSALAGVLIVTALRMVKPQTLLEAFVTTKSNAITMVITALSTVALDLIKAVVIGIVVHLALSKIPSLNH